MKRFSIIIPMFLLVVSIQGQSRGLAVQETNIAEPPSLESFFSKSNLIISLHTEKKGAYLQKEPGIFCKMDKSLDARLPMSLRFRLGEYHYTRRLEYGDQDN